MAAELLLCGDFSPTLGGDFERTALESLRDGLAQDCVLIGKLNLPTAGGEFYDLDVVVAGVGFCTVLELKCMRPIATVFEDCIKGINGFSLDRVFSLLNNKARVLASRLARAPFAGIHVPRVESHVVVPDGVSIDFRFSDHKTNKKVMSLSEILRLLRGNGRAASRTDFVQLRDRWRRYTSDLAAPGTRTARTLGRFRIKRTISSSAEVREYQAVDEPPCEVDVHLKEFAYDPLGDALSLQEELERLSREMRTLRSIRHPNVACVIGHFLTGTSLVQVSDWFDGQALDAQWGVIGETSLVDKVALMTKLCEALEFCHQTGIFHRDIRSGNVMLSDNLADLRLRGFAFARNLAFSSSLSASELNQRAATVIGPEELLGGRPVNPRLLDVFQAGVLFYTIVENGEMPFNGALDLCTGERIRQMHCHCRESGVEEIRNVIFKMLSIDPADRPQLMQEVASTIRHAAAS